MFFSHFFEIFCANVIIIMQRKLKFLTSESEVFFEIRNQRFNNFPKENNQKFQITFARHASLCKQALTLKFLDAHQFSSRKFLPNVEPKFTTFTENGNEK